MVGALRAIAARGKPMRTDMISKALRLAGLVGLVVALFAVFLSLVRPWYLHWGASAREFSGPLPGDEFVDARSQSTRAIDIDAPAAKVWPWLLQLGQDRGGFYSYELLENLVGTNMHNVDTLNPALQRWKIGDKLWMYPPDKLGGLVLRCSSASILGACWYLAPTSSGPYPRSLRTAPGRSSCSRSTRATVDSWCAAAALATLRLGRARSSGSCSSPCTS